MAAAKSNRSSESRDPEERFVLISDSASEHDNDAYKAVRADSHPMDEKISPHAAVRPLDSTLSLTLQQLRRVSSRYSSAATAPYDPPPPDGGWQAWSTCLCAHVVIANTWGIMNSFGVFVAYYIDFLHLPPSPISWIGSLQLFLAFFLASVTGRIADAGYFQPLYWFGAALLVLGVFAASACTQYWQLMLAQGVCIGLGAGCLSCPVMGVSSTYFSSRRGMAVAIVTMGNVTGGLAFPALARQLIPRVGFGWAMRATGFIQLSCLIACGLVMRARLTPRASGPLLEFKAFREPEFAFYCVGMCLVSRPLPLLPCRPSVVGKWCSVQDVNACSELCRYLRSSLLHCAFWPRSDRTEHVLSRLTQPIADPERPGLRGTPSSGAVDRSRWTRKSGAALGLFELRLLPCMDSRAHTSPAVRVEQPVLSRGRIPPGHLRRRVGLVGARPASSGHAHRHGFHARRLCHPTWPACRWRHHHRHGWTVYGRTIVRGIFAANRHV